MRQEIISAAVAIHGYVCQYHGEVPRWTRKDLRWLAIHGDRRLRGFDDPPAQKWYKGPAWAIKPAIDQLIADGVLVNYPDYEDGDWYGIGLKVDTWEPPAPESEEQAVGVAVADNGLSGRHSCSEIVKHFGFNLKAFDGLLRRFRNHNQGLVGKAWFREDESCGSRYTYLAEHPDVVKLIRKSELSGGKKAPTKRGRSKNSRIFS
jgi:hypothetical protein